MILKAFCPGTPHGKISKKLLLLQNGHSPPAVSCKWSNWCQLWLMESPQFASCLSTEWNTQEFHKRHTLLFKISWETLAMNIYSSLHLSHDCFCLRNMIIYHPFRKRPRPIHTDQLAHLKHACSWCARVNRSPAGHIQTQLFLWWKEISECMIIISSGWNACAEGVELPRPLHKWKWLPLLYSIYL